MESAPLAGRTVVVTRPAHQCAGLVAGLREAGANALVFPLLAISPADDPRPLQAAVADFAQADLACFISPNAVAHALPALLARGGWPAKTLACAVGKSTEAALLAAGVPRVLAPRDRFDSEALLALPPLAAEAVAGREVFIFRGNGGRELLADTLIARGGRVRLVTCYRRDPPAADPLPLQAAWAAGRLDAITLSSSEGLRHLLEMLSGPDRDRLRATPLFVPHARIAENARAAGLNRVVLTAAGDDGLLAGLKAYNWP